MISEFWIARCRSHPRVYYVSDQRMVFRGKDAVVFPDMDAAYFDKVSLECAKTLGLCVNVACGSQIKVKVTSEFTILEEVKNEQN